AAGKDFKDRFGGVKEGDEVRFRAATKDGQAVLVGLAPGRAAARPAPPKFDASGLKPLAELGTRKYYGFEGGLYPGGTNERPAAHEAAGLALAAQVRPLDAAGKPAADGKVVLLSVGMSNTTQEF